MKRKSFIVYIYIFFISLFLFTNLILFKTTLNNLQFVNSYLYRRIKVINEVKSLENDLWTVLRSGDEEVSLKIVELIKERDSSVVGIIPIKINAIWRAEAINRWGEEYLSWHFNGYYQRLAGEFFGMVKNSVAEVLSSCGFEDEAVKEIQTAAYELAGNVFRHADKGFIIIRRISDSSGRSGIEIVSIDKGRGITEENMTVTVENEMARWGWSGSTGYGFPRMQAFMEFNLNAAEDGNIITLRRWSGD